MNWNLWLIKDPLKILLQTNETNQRNNLTIQKMYYKKYTLYGTSEEADSVRNECCSFGNKQ